MEEFPWYPRCQEKKVVALKSFYLAASEGIDQEQGSYIIFQGSGSHY
jgi:hypothetical protein